MNKTQAGSSGKFGETPNPWTRKGCDCLSLFGSNNINQHYCSATTAIRAKISRLTTIENTRHMIRLHKKSKIIKANSTDLPVLSLPIEIPCLCDQIDNDKIRKGRWLLLGIVRDRTFTLTLLTKWKKKNKEFKKTIRKLKKSESKICGDHFRPSDRNMAGLTINGQKVKGRQPKRQVRKEDI